MNCDVVDISLINSLIESLDIFPFSGLIIYISGLDSISILSQQAKQNQTSVTSFQPPVKTVPIPEKQGIDVKKFPQVKLLSGKGSLDFDVSKEQFQAKTGELESSDKNILQAVCQNVLTEYDKYERESMQAVVSELSSLVEDDNICDRKKAYIVAAMGAYLLEDFKRASEYFYYADDLRSAYLSAYLANVAFGVNTHPPNS